MANFQIAIKKVLANEGGYVNDPDDTGGETYKGVARKMHPKWEGWQIVDQLKSLKDFPACLDDSQVLHELIIKFYREKFWDTINGDFIERQDVAESIFDFGVNVFWKTSAMLAQMVVGAVPDGNIGANTLDKLNRFDSKHFLAAFAALKIARYIDIVRKNNKNMKFFYGWVKRAIDSVTI